jgi:hypothetical protein
MVPGALIILPDEFLLVDAIHDEKAASKQLSNHGWQGVARNRVPRSRREVSLPELWLQHCDRSGKSVVDGLPAVRKIDRYIVSRRHEHRSKLAQNARLPSA